MILPTTIVDPEKIAWKGDALQVVFSIPDGLVGILPGHADAAFSITPCILRYTTTDHSEHKLFLSGGVARVRSGVLTIVADSAETPESIDRQRAEKAKQRAEERLRAPSHSINIDRARVALQKAIFRLQITA